MYFSFFLFVFVFVLVFVLVFLVLVVPVLLVFGVTASLAYLFCSASPCHGLGSRTSLDRLRRIGGGVVLAIVNSAGRESGALILLRGFGWPGCPGCHGRSRAMAEAVTLLLVVTPSQLSMWESRSSALSTRNAALVPMWPTAVPQISRC